MSLVDPSPYHLKKILCEKYVIFVWYYSIPISFSRSQFFWGRKNLEKNRWTHAQLIWFSVDWKKVLWHICREAKKREKKSLDVRDFWKNRLIARIFFTILANDLPYWLTPFGNFGSCTGITLSIITLCLSPNEMKV